MNERFRVALISLSALTLALFPSAVSAQIAGDTAVTAGAPSASSAANQLGPARDGLTVGVRRQSAPVAAEEVLQQRRGAGLSQSEALMIVGGAAILVGAIIGGDPGKVIMIGGAVVGLVGLYKYLQ